MKIRIAILVAIALLIPTLSHAQYWRALPAITPERAQLLSFSADEKYVFYLSQESGVGNIYRVPVKGGKPEQLTKYTDGWVLRPIATVGRPHIVFMRPMTPGQFDFHLFIMNQDGSGEPRDLTPWAGSTNEIVGASYTGRYVYYTSNKTTKEKFDVYRYDVWQNISELVFTNDRDYKPVMWTKDQTKVVLLNPSTSATTTYDINTTEINDYALDLKSAEPSINGKFLIDRSSESVKVLEASSKAPLALTEPVNNVGIAPRETLIAYTVPAADGTKLFIYDVNKKTSTELATIR